MSIITYRDRPLEYKDMCEELEINTLEELRNLDLFGRITKVFDEAEKKGDLVFKEASDFERINDKKSKMEYEIKVVEALAKRPNNRASEPGSDTKITQQKIEDIQKKNPFLHPEPELTIVNSLFSTYRLILNKYPNTKYHFLLVTKEFEKQDTLLKPIELQIMHTILENLNSKIEKENMTERYFSFFNSGPESGYSQFHKHIQFMLLPSNFHVYQEDVVRGVGYFIPKEIIENRRPLFHKQASFKHYILKLKDDPSDEEDEQDSLAILYMYLIKRVLNIYKEYGMERSKVSYNFLMMSDWMMIVPRRAAKYEEVWQNSLGFMGLFCVKNEDLKNRVLNLGFAKILEECGFPMEDDEEHIVYNEYGY